MLVGLINHRMRSNESAQNGSACGGGLALSAVLAVSMLARVSREYRPFPSIDEFIYLPLSWAGLYPKMYSSDMLIQDNDMHLPIWKGLVYLLENSVGLAPGFWGLTLLLSVFSALAVWQLLRILGSGLAVLPLAVLLPFLGYAELRGIGRGVYDGAFGDGFHAQWLAVVILLFAYAEVSRGRWLRGGALLGFAALSHLLIGVHGAVCFGFAAFFERKNGLKHLSAAGALCGLISLPVVLPRLPMLFDSSKMLWPIDEIISKGYIFRTPHEYLLENLTSFNHAVTIALVLFLTLAAYYILRRVQGESVERGRLAGLWVGQLFLGLLSVVFHAEGFREVFDVPSLLIYQLHLTRTTPILVLLSSVVIAAAGASAVADLYKATPTLDRSFRAAFLVCCLIVLVLVVPWSWATLVLALLAVPLAVVGKSPQLERPIMICLLLIGISGFGYCAKTDQLSLDLPAEEQEVYEWAKSNTADTDLFIIPPGLYHFRFFAQRGAYVDFKIFPASNPALIPEWRRRLEQVSHPDKIALAEKGYAALPYLDRTYATRNGSEEILKLLEDTEAKYFLRDVEGLAIPPFVPIKSVDDLRLEKVFSNDRFEVFRLKSGD